MTTKQQRRKNRKIFLIDAMFFLFFTTLISVNATTDFAITIGIKQPYLMLASVVGILVTIAFGLWLLSNDRHLLQWK